MTDTFTRGEESARLPERPTFDAVARLASLSRSTPEAARVAVFGRRDESVPDAATYGPADTDTVPEAGTVEEAGTDATGQIGRLTRLSAAEVWTDDGALAAWLASDPAALGDVLGTTLRDVTTEGSANRLTATSADGGSVTILCEVGVTSDAALARLLASAAVGTDSQVVWVAGEIDPGHGATISWLNRTTATRFVVVRVEAVRIGTSPAAPLLEVAVRPARAGDPQPQGASGGTLTEGRRADDHTPAEDEG